MRRHLIGMLALVLWAGALVFWFFPPPASGFLMEAQAGCWRCGTVLAMWWLAWPQVSRLPRWLLVAVPLLAIVLVVNRKMLIVAVPLILALALLMPRASSPPPRRKRGR